MLLCEACGADIRIVPEYETQVEARIAATMTSITEALDREEQKKQSEAMRAETLHRQHRRIFFLLTGLVTGIVLTAAVFFVFVYRYRHSESFFLARAYEAAQSGDFGLAAETVQKALDVTGEGSKISLLLLKEEYFCLDDNEAGVRSCLSQILEAPELTDQEEAGAYAHLITLYESRGDYAAIAAFLEDPAHENLRSHYRDYCISVPVFDSEAGTYEDELHLSLHAEAGEEIHVRVMKQGEEGEPVLYTEPLVLTEGEYTVEAYAVNRFRVESERVTNTYVITPSRPPKPIIRPLSGTYHTAEDIHPEPEEILGGTLHYTTDGTDPTKESPVYEGPIPMPAGASHFKFAIINAAGVSGEVAEVNYSLSVGSRFSEADARGNILSAMLQMGEITDPEGTVRDGAGKLSYRFLAEQEIAGSGYFFLFEESITDAAGNLAVTWRRFAVSTATGTVYLMEEPTPGGYVLTPVG